MTINILNGKIKLKLKKYDKKLRAYSALIINSNNFFIRDFRHIH